MHSCASFCGDSSVLWSIFYTKMSEPGLQTDSHRCRRRHRGEHSTDHHDHDTHGCLLAKIENIFFIRISPGGTPIDGQYAYAYLSIYLSSNNHEPSNQY